MVEKRRKRKIGSKLLRLAIAVVPAAGDKIRNLPLVWPPLGSIETYAAGVAVVVIGFFGALPVLIKTKSHAKKGAKIGLGLSLASLFIYGFFLLTYVKGVETPKNGVQYRTIGSQRTDEAEQKFPGKSDAEILQNAGLTDGDIERMWTPSSVSHARIGLFISYILCFAAANFAIGAFSRASPDTTPK
jgi:hypothetical protein